MTRTLFAGALVLWCGCREERIPHEPMTSVAWKIDTLESIGGIKPNVLGSPKIIETPKGRAIEFDGKQDGLQLDVHPLAGWSEFTLEVLFRPDPGGLEEQRFFHLHEAGSENRMLIETRLTPDGRWFLDTFIKSGSTEQTLYAKDFLHPVGQWHQAALVFDGKEMRHYVNGVQELSAPIQFTPHSKGGTSIGVRANRVFWFKGAIREVRFTPRALAPDEFLRP